MVLKAVSGRASLASLRMPDRGPADHPWVTPVKLFHADTATRWTALVASHVACLAQKTGIRKLMSLLLEAKKLENYVIACHERYFLRQC